MTAPTHIDLQTARTILAGNDQAFKELFDRFFPRLYRFARTRLDNDDDAAAEVVQQTFCKAIDKLDTYRGEAALYTWFCQICRNTLIDYCRARQREVSRISPLEDQISTRAILEMLTAPVNQQPETEAWRTDIGRLVQATVDTLPAKYGDVLEWKYIDGLTVQEIATRLQVGAKAAESLLTRARVAFRNGFSELVGSVDEIIPPTAL